MDRVTLPGSTFVPAPSSTPARAAPDEVATISVILRARQPAPGASDDPDWERPLLHRQDLSREELAARHGAHAGDLDGVASWLKGEGLDVVSTSVASRRVEARGPAGRVAEVLGVTPRWFRHPRRSHRGYEGALSVPAEVAPLVVSILGLSDRPCARPRAAAPGGDVAPLSAEDVAEMYAFPSVHPGRMPCIGVVELGGGYRAEDLAAFFGSLRMPVPEIVDVPVGGAANAPSSPEDVAAFLDMAYGRKGPVLEGEALERAMWTVEATMDLELLGALAPGAKLVAYFGGSDDRGLVAGLSAALHDTVHRPSVISLSWSEPEPDLGEHVRAVAEELLKDSAHLGVTLCGSSGDAGSGNGATDGKPSVSFPASSPYVLACGGTTVILAERRRAGETVWNGDFHGRPGATGGGVSDWFPRPAWQRGLAVPERPRGGSGRGVPDVAADADPATGCRIVVGGKDAVSSGTSAAAPIWAALLARIGAALGRPVGYLNPLLYRLERDGPAMLHDVTRGDNGAYAAEPGWDACTGWGTPSGELLLRALREGR